jgi:predicted XRE-type DNA-binding protein
MTNPHVGSSFDDFLAEEGILEEVEAVAIKRILARQVSEAMKAQRLTKKAMAERMGTSRSALDRLLEPENTSVTLRTLQKAASTVGRRLRLELV